MIKSKYLKFFWKKNLFVRLPKNRPTFFEKDIIQINALIEKGYRVERMFYSTGKERPECYCLLTKG